MKSYEKYISKENVKKIHENTLKILENVGVLFENERALDVFRSHGFKTDGQKVFFTQKQVEDALALVPQSFELHVAPDKKITFGGKDKLITALGGNIYINDGGKIRRTKNEDIVNQFKMAATSPYLTTSNMNVLDDYSKCTREEKIWGGMAIQMKYSDKYHCTLGPNTHGMSDVDAYNATKESVQLLRRFKGLENAQYVAIRGLNALSPLTFDKIPLERLFANLEERQPIAMYPCAMPLLTAAPSMAGMISQNNAEVLSGLVFCQLVAPGLPFVYGNVSGSTDMKYIQLCIGAPEAALVAYATAGLADLYKLPFRAGGSLSDAKDVDAQAGAESMMMIYASLDCGADYMMHGIGCMGSFNIIALEKFILDEEIMMMVERELKGIDCTEEKLCFDEIAKVGPRGTFLHGRTPKMYREEFVMAKLFNKDDPNNWQNSGAASIKETAGQAVKNRLESFVAPQRTKEQLALIDKYIPQEYREKI